MNQILTQIQEDELKKFDKVYFDRSQDGHPYAGDPLYDRLKSFLTQSNQRVLEKVKQWVDEHKWLDDNGEETNSPVNATLNDLKNFLSLIEQK